MLIDREKLKTQIADQKRRLELLERIDSDPSMLPLLESLMVNGTSTVKPVISAAKMPAPGKKGYVSAAIAKAALACEKPFSGYILAKKMEGEGFHFEADKPGLAVTEALRALAKKEHPVVRIFKNGKGSVPTLFERILPQ